MNTSHVVVMEGDASETLCIVKDGKAGIDIEIMINTVDRTAEGNHDCVHASIYLQLHETHAGATYLIVSFPIFFESNCQLTAS